ncbi:MAG: hypothetical protein GY769_05450 [bacterium]|nr:hypothetical protein [bacterium]
MRRLTTELCAIPVICLLLVALPAAARSHKARKPVTAIQPTDSTSHLVLLSRPGWARIQSDRGRRRVALHREETSTTVAETVSGWVLGGVRTSETGSSVFLMSSATETGARLPALEQRDALQLRPVLLVHDRRLTGAAWLEGESQRTMAVRFAEWTGIGWGPARTVSRPGPGSQTGLSGTTLRNGDVLLAWSRFDGSDDEIFWSLREGSTWSSPARVGADNSTPDITPALAAAGRGAALVWSRMDGGEYRLLARRFRSGEWQSERVLGPAGSAFPTLVRSDDTLMALYRTARPRGWSVTELNGGSPIPRRGRIHDTRSQRPVVAGIGSSGPILRWLRPGRSATVRWGVRR